MKIFLSWSGDISRQLASHFKEWLPNVLQFVDPYMSSQDIELGERWNDNITRSLSETDYGLIFVTEENIKAPWINFEAGALSKALSSRVVPILFNADVMILQEGPLKQFQSSKTIEKESIFKLIQEINNNSSDKALDITRLEKSFNMWWDILEKDLKAIKQEPVNTENTKVDQLDVLSAIVNKLNEQERLIKGIRNENKHSARDLNKSKFIENIIDQMGSIEFKIAEVYNDLSDIHDREGIFSETRRKLSECVEELHIVSNRITKI